MTTQAEKGSTFRALHGRSGAFIIPNPWDIGTSRLLAHLGFEALATTSMGYAFSLGRLDSSLSREETLKHASAIVSAAELCRAEPSGPTRAAPDASPPYPGDGLLGAGGAFSIVTILCDSQ